MRRGGRERQEGWMRWFEEERVPDLVIIVRRPWWTQWTNSGGLRSTMIKDVPVIRSAKSLHSSLWFISLLHFIPWSSKSFHPKQLFTPFTRGLHPPWQKVMDLQCKKADSSLIINSYWKDRCISWQLGPKKPDNQWKMSLFESLFFCGKLRSKLINAGLTGMFAARDLSSFVVFCCVVSPLLPPRHRQRWPRLTF